MSATRLLLEPFRTSGASNIISADTQVDATTDSAASGVTTADCHSTFHFDAIVGEMCFTLATKQTQIPLAFYGNGRTRRGWRGVEPRKPCDEPACLCPKAFAMMYILNCPHALA